MGIKILKRVNKDKQYQKEVIEIMTVTDLLNLLNSDEPTYQFIGVPSAVEKFIEDGVKNNLTFSYKKFYSALGKHFFRAKFPAKKEFWLNRGYTEEHAIEKVKESQSIGGKGYSKKRKLDPEKYYASNPKRVEYWLNHGFTLEEAKEQIAKNQARGIDFYLSRYDEETANLLMKERNERWQTSLEKSKGILWNTSDRSLSFKSYEKRYGKDWILVKIQHTKKEKSKKILQRVHELISEQKNLEDFLMTLEFEEFLDYLRNMVVQYFLKNPINLVIERWLKEKNITRIKCRYGFFYYHNGRVYQSTAEYKIGIFLEKSEILFECHKKYEGTSRYSDFYLPEFDIYIEYMGMTEISYTKKRSELLETPYRIFWSKNVQEITNFIKKKIDEKNHR